MKVAHLLRQKHSFLEFIALYKTPTSPSAAAGGNNIVNLQAFLGDDNSILLVLAEFYI